MNIKLLSPFATQPVRKHQTDAGLDLFSCETRILKPGDRHQFKLGLSIETPIGTFGLVQGRSGLAINHGITTIGNVIDEGYSGEISAIIINTGKEDVEIKVKDRIAQLLIIPYLDEEVMIVDEFNKKTERGDSGYGSSGK